MSDEASAEFSLLATHRSLLITHSSLLIALSQNIDTPERIVNARMDFNVDAL
jgi:hypothetical protein